MLPKVFDLFTQVGNSLDRAQGGLGIGLALVKNLVELHGGTVTAESRGVGQGSTFTVRFPLVMGEPVQSMDVNSSEPSVAKCSRRILVVDDNIDGAESLAMLLELAGHETVIAHNGPDAVDLAKKLCPDVVLLDIGAPRMNGYEVAKRLWADEGRGRLVLVAIKGWGSDEDRKRSEEAGFDFHLTKPVARTVSRDRGELNREMFLRNRNYIYLARTPG